jgi:hypothetical protein
MRWHENVPPERAASKGHGSPRAASNDENSLGRAEAETIERDMPKTPQSWLNAPIPTDGPASPLSRAARQRCAALEIREFRPCASSR